MDKPGRAARALDAAAVLEEEFAYLHQVESVGADLPCQVQARVAWAWA